MFVPAVNEAGDDIPPFAPVVVTSQRSAGKDCSAPEFTCRSLTAVESGANIGWQYPLAFNAAGKINLQYRGHLTFDLSSPIVAAVDDSKDKIKGNDLLIASTDNQKLRLLKRGTAPAGETPSVPGDYCPILGIFQVMRVIRDGICLVRYLPAPQWTCLTTERVLANNASVARMQVMAKSGDDIALGGTGQLISFYNCFDRIGSGKNVIIALLDGCLQPISECCGKTTIRRIDVETGKIVWSNFHGFIVDSPNGSAGGGEFEYAVFLNEFDPDAYGEDPPPPELLVLGNTVADEKWGLIARYRDSGQDGSLVDYSDQDDEFGKPNNVPMPYWLAVRMPSGNIFAGIGADFVGDPGQILGLWNSDKQIIGERNFDGAIGPANLNGKEYSIDLIMSDTNEDVAFRVDENLDIVQQLRESDLFPPPDGSIEYINPRGGTSFAGNGQLVGRHHFFHYANVGSNGISPGGPPSLLITPLILSFTPEQVPVPDVWDAGQQWLGQAAKDFILTTGSNVYLPWDGDHNAYRWTGSTATDGVTVSVEALITPTNDDESDFTWTINASFSGTISLGGHDYTDGSISVGSSWTSDPPLTVPSGRYNLSLVTVDVPGSIRDDIEGHPPYVNNERYASFTRIWQVKDDWTLDSYFDLFYEVFGSRLSHIIRGYYPYQSIVANGKSYFFGGSGLGQGDPTDFRLMEFDLSPISFVGSEVLSGEPRYANVINAQILIETRRADGVYIERWDGLTFKWATRIAKSGQVQGVNRPLITNPLSATAFSIAAGTGVAVMGSYLDDSDEMFEVALLDWETGSISWKVQHSRNGKVAPIYHGVVSSDQKALYVVGRSSASEEDD